MLENKFQIPERIAAYLREDISASELEELNAWLAESEANRNLLNTFDTQKGLSERLKVFNDADEAAIWTKTISKLNEQRTVKKRTIKLFNRFVISKVAAAAVILLMLGFGLYVWKEKTKNTTLYANDIAPGKVGATLTLSNGKKIRLNSALNGKIAEESGISVTKSAAGELVYEVKESSLQNNSINTLSTANGETYTIVLPDHSKVWMNAASSLTYATSLNDRGVRRVKLDGEAYFEVAKDKTHPFIVESNGQQVAVLGTHFNVNSYPDEESLKTTLLEGSVKITTSHADYRILKPGQQSSLSATGNLTVADVKPELFTAWKDNKFIFDDYDIKSVMRMVQRWYNVEVVYVGPLPEDNFGGKVSRFDHVSSVLRILESTGGVHFKVEDRKIYVSR